MFSGRRLLEAAIIAVPLALGGGGCGEVAPLNNIRSHQYRVEFQVDYQQALHDARRDGKPLLVVIKAAWCPFSRELLRDTFANHDVVRASDQFVCVLVDAEKQPELCRSLNATRAYPTIQFFSANKTLLRRVEGSRTPKELLADMRRATSAMARRPLPARLIR